MRCAGVLGRSSLGRSIDRSVHVFVAVAAVAFCGCGGSEPVDSIDKPLFPAAGKISYRGKPIPNARVTFHPVESLGAGGLSANPVGGSGTESTPAPLVRTPFAIVKEDGTFELSTLKLGDGAPEGEYAVTVSWTGEKPTVSDSDLPEKLPPKYQNPAFSGLKVRVKQGEAIPELKLN
jgi:hypothetical protein